MQNYESHTRLHPSAKGDYLVKKHVLLATFLALAIVVTACGKAEPAGPPEIVEATFARGLSEQMEPINPGNESYTTHAAA